MVGYSKMKQTDIKIIQHLRNNARNSITKISRKTGIPTSTVFVKLKDLEKDIIKKYTALLDYSKIGYHDWHKTAVKLEGGHQQDFEDYVYSHENINSVYEINGGFHYLIESVHKNIRDYMDFIKEMQTKFDVEEMKQFQIIRDIKREALVIPD